MVRFFLPGLSGARELLRARDARHPAMLVQRSLLLPRAARLLSCRRALSSASPAAKPPGTAQRRRAVMVCGVKQHTGKTSVCMALFSNLRQQLSPASVGYMKPVGQEWVEVHSEGEGEGSLLRVDKDAALAYQVGRRPT